MATETNPASMRTARLLGQCRSFYHFTSRVVDRRMLFKPRDKHKKGNQF